MSGRHREHVFPARRHRVAPSFTAEEYAAIVAAAARAGLTPTGFCGRAAVAMATTDSELHRSPQADPARTGRGEGTRPSAAAAERLRGERMEALAGVQAELADMRIAVVRVGTNLNQAVAAFHATGQAPVWLARVVELCGRALASVDVAASRLHRRLP